MGCCLCRQRDFTRGICGKDDIYSYLDLGGLFMSWWTDLRDTWEYAQTAGLYDPGKNRKEEQQARYMANDQIKAYKEQTAIAREEIERKRGEMNSEKRRVEEKQIRSLRHRYRPAGFLDNQSSLEGTSTKLGV